MDRRSQAAERALARNRNQDQDEDLEDVERAEGAGDQADDDAGDEDADETPETERLEATISTLVERAEARAMARAQETIDRALSRARRPNREQVERVFGNRQERVERDGERGPAVQVRGGDVVPYRRVAAYCSPQEFARYRNLPDAERLIRRPDGDHFMAEWFRGFVQRDHQRMGRALQELERIEGYDFGRANILEGTTTAGSGLSQGSGGAIVPLPFANLVVRARDKRGKLRPLCQRFTSDNLTLRVPVSSVATAAMAAEGAVAAQGEPTFTNVLLSKKKMQANFQVSDEMLADSAFDLISFLSERAGSAFAALEDVQICTSNGTPPNITSALSSISETAEGTPATLNYADVVALFFALPEQYQAGSVWLADAVTCSLLSRIRTTGGLPLLGLQQGPATVVSDTRTIGAQGIIGEMFGRPVYNVPLASGSLFIANMDFYGILDGGPIVVKQSEHALWTTDSFAIRFTERFDGAVLLAAAFAKTIGLTTAGT